MSCLCKVVKLFVWHELTSGHWCSFWAHQIVKVQLLMSVCTETVAINRKTERFCCTYDTPAAGRWRR